MMKMPWSSSTAWELLKRSVQPWDRMGRTRYRAPVYDSRACGYRRLDAHRPSRSSHVVAIANLECCYVGLLCEPVASVPWYRCTGAGYTSHGAETEPNTKKKVELHHLAALTSPVRQACRGFPVEEADDIHDNAVYANNSCGHLPVSNTIVSASGPTRARPLAYATAKASGSSGTSTRIRSGSNTRCVWQGRSQEGGRRGQSRRPLYNA